MGIPVIDWLPFGFHLEFGKENEMEAEMNRRSFLGASAVALGAASFFKSAFVFAQGAAKDAAVKASEIFKTGEPTTVAQFCTDVKDKKACPERQKPERKDQYCDNCQFYVAAGKDAGKCQLIPPKGEKKYVGAKAWCQTWVKKAGT